MPIIRNEDYSDVEIVVGGTYEFISHYAPDYDEGPQYEAGDRVTVKSMRHPEGWNQNQWMVDIGDCEINAMRLRPVRKNADEVRAAVREWLDARKTLGLLTDSLAESLERTLAETEPK